MSMKSSSSCISVTPPSRDVSIIPINSPCIHKRVVYIIFITVLSNIEKINQKYAAITPGSTGLARDSGFHGEKNLENLGTQNLLIIAFIIIIDIV